MTKSPNPENFAKHGQIGVVVNGGVFTYDAFIPRQKWTHVTFAFEVDDGRAQTADKSEGIEENPTATGKEGGNPHHHHHHHHKDESSPAGIHLYLNGKSHGFLSTKVCGLVNLPMLSLGACDNCRGLSYHGLVLDVRFWNKRR